MEHTEEITDLFYQNLKVIQKTDGFRFGTDAVLLSAFARLKHKDCAVDLCTGSGVIPILLNGLYAPRYIYAVEIQKDYADRAIRSIRMNQMENVTVLCRNLIGVHREIGEKADVVTCNPPYMKADTGKENEKDEKTLARHEVACTLEDVICEASRLLKSGGRLCMVHRPERLADLMVLMRNFHLEPKRLQLVYPAKGKPTSLVLMEGGKDRNPGLIIEKPILMADEAGREYNPLTEEWKR